MGKQNQRNNNNNKNTMIENVKETQDPTVRALNGQSWNDFNKKIKEYLIIT